MRQHPETYAEALEIVEEGARLRLPLYRTTRSGAENTTEHDAMMNALDVLSRFRAKEVGVEEHGASHLTVAVKTASGCPLCWTSTGSAPVTS